MTSESRSWITVASGPPEGGIVTATMEQPRQHHRHDGGRGTGGEQGDGDGDGDVGAAPQSDSDGQEGDSKGETDEGAGQQLTAEDSPDAHADRKAANDERLRLRANGISHVDDFWDEEGDKHVALERTAEGVEQLRRGDRPE